MRTASDGGEEGRAEEDEFKRSAFWGPNDHPAPRRKVRGGGRTPPMNDCKRLASPAARDRLHVRVGRTVGCVLLRMGSLLCVRVGAHRLSAKESIRMVPVQESLGGGRIVRA
jgi:hypothetical protein